MLRNYPVIKYKRFFCVPACLKSILKSKNLGSSITLWKIGNHLGLKVPKKFVNDYPDTKISQSNNFQINLHKPKYSINSFFKSCKLPLKEKYFYRSKTSSIKILLKKFSESDIIVCFDYPTLFNIQNKHWGHVSLITNFDDNFIYLQDVKSLKKYKKSYETLSKSIKKHSRKKRAGFWIISEN